MSIKIFGILPRRNLLFVKRAMYTSLEQNLNASKSVVLSGLTNRGKTELILEYVHEQVSTTTQDNQRYNSILWVQAGDYDQLINSCKKIAKQLNINLEQKTDEKLLEEIFEKLQAAEDHWLLVIDNLQANYSVRNKDNSLRELSSNELLEQIPSWGGDIVITTQTEVSSNSFVL